MIWSGRFDDAQLALLDSICAWGFKAVEVPLFDVDSFAPAALRKAAEARGLERSVSTALPGDLSLLSPDPAVRARTVDWINRGIDKIAELGAVVWCGPFYHPVGQLPGRRRTEDEWKRAVDGLGQVGPKLAASGVKIAVEPINRFETYFLNTAADTRRFVDEINHPSIGVLFDTFHANLEEDSITEAIAACGPRLMHVHLCENNRGVPGCGHVPFAEVAEALKKLDFHGLGVVESFASSIPEIAAATAMWRDYAKSSDDFAERSGANLQRWFPQ